MRGFMAWARCLFPAALAVIALPAAAASPPTSGTVQPLDLAGPFGTRSPWRVTVSQGAPVDDPTGMQGTVPGAIEVCLQKGADGPCDPALLEMLRAEASDDLYSTPHSLDQMRIVRPHGTSGTPILLVATSSAHSVDNDQRSLTQALSYDSTIDRFVRVYEHVGNSNNNQEVRYLESGAPQGDIVSVDPAQDAPFGFWVVVNAPDPGGSYRIVLRYRSATQYGDNNPLAVIDSEMPNIQQHLGLWRTGAPLPLPEGPCPKPHLVRMELWCR